jgi:5-methylcytosine-specific restriction endonuclease McrA
MNCNTKHRIKKELKLKKCRYCGSRENLTIDHKHPIILGGTNERKNLQCLCYDCNQLKADIPDKVFRKIMKFGAFLELQNK